MTLVEVACIAMVFLSCGCGKSSHPLIGTWRYDGSTPVGAVDQARTEADASFEKLIQAPRVPAGIVADGEARLPEIWRRRALKAELRFRANGTVTQTVRKTEFAEPQVTHGTWEGIGQRGFVYLIAIRWNGAFEPERNEFSYHPAQVEVDEPTHIRLDLGEVGGVSEISFALVPEK